ncbi:sensor histidine kinase [Nocardioides lianchengensis]|uniref:Sensor-like histidine kinase SenX3 n=1 Tax=Nocardioides lianchengensis TaxID=1045774 RepID=A0A1G6N041_9ACTN|nr:GAF domain-containing sensor histidine kinase [Nocardioides lianchengensis]NYG10598.1 signal transduction histidine kinase [Nocardioides lianchengensis]SDC60807.1 Signal transduction histidine kinase [Nocardioides lianchengensis]
MTLSVTTDEVRVAQIGRYQVVTRPPRSDLVSLVEIAAQVADVPMATINLITDTEQHQIATAGFAASVCAREDSMCNVVFQGGVPVIVPDASQDDRFRDNPFVTGVIGDVRFYATHPLRTPEGTLIGTLCVFDTVVRSLSDAQEAALVHLADRVVDLLELELRTRELSTTVEDLRDTQAELERSNEVLAAFAGQVAHDLRNPLSAVTMSLSLIAEESEEEGGDTFLIDRATSGAQRMQDLIDDLLSFARLGGELSRVPVDLAAVLGDVREDLATALAGATVEVGDLPVVTGDPVQLRAVLQNLIANAAKFVRAGQPAHIEIDSTRLGDHWRVEVCDRGPGIPADQQERVFQPLARVSTEVEGSGIGLATCRRIVEAHGGRIGLNDAAYGGTCAWFELPA